MGAQSNERGFGGSASRSKSSRREHSVRRPSDDASDIRKHQALYQQHVLPWLIRGELSQAESILKLLAQSKTRVAEVYRDLANLSESRQQLDETQAYRELWLNHPSEDEFELLSQAETAVRLDREQLAARLFETLLKRGPTAMTPRLAVIRHLLLQECFQEAREHLESWFGETSDPVIGELWSICAIELQDPELACHLAQACLRESPSPAAHAVLAAALHHQSRESEAYGHLKSALALSSDAQSMSWPVPRLLVRVCLDQNRLEEAEQLLCQARLDQPMSRQLLAQWGELELLRGQWTEGFRLCALSRSSDLSLPPATAFAQESTDTISDLPPLILASDGTLGDALLFSRYAPWLAASLDRPVHLYVQPPVLNLLKGSFQSPIEVFPLGMLDAQSSELILPMQDAAAVFGACDQHPALAAPCLQADPALVEIWRERLDLDVGERLIAINWNGSALRASRGRVSSDIPLNAFETIAQIPGVRLLSLQKGFGAEQLRHCRFADRFVSCQKQVSDEMRLEHMAALITLCECVICDDSGPAHLAGGLNSPTILLLPERAGWRWGVACSHSPWYPTLHLLRRSQSKGWDELMSEAHDLLTGLPTNL